jgi:dTMP kinase
MSSTSSSKGLPAAAAVMPTPGQLIVIEGPDCAGRSTQVRLLQDWLERQGHGVVATSLCRGALTEETLEKAKHRTMTSRPTLALLYAADLADRLERQIRPALEGGFIVLCDRYIYTLLARYAVRGLDPAWLRDVFSFAPAPHLALFLQTKLDDLTARALHAGRMGYWECGLDLCLSNDLHESFKKYQRRMLRQFRDIVREYGLIRVPGGDGMDAVQQRLRRQVARHLVSTDAHAPGYTSTQPAPSPVDRRMP